MDNIKKKLEDEVKSGMQKHGSIPNDSGMRQKDGKFYERDEKTCPECGSFLLSEKGKYNCVNCGFKI